MASPAGTTIAKRNHLPAVTHTTNTFGPMCKVKFVYKDNPKEPLKNRFVLYWLYDGKGAKLDKVPAASDYWHRLSLIMPGGCSHTDENGVLQPTYPINNFSFVFNNDNTNYFTYNRGNLSVEFDQSIFRNPVFNSDKFPLGRKVGFLVMPLDMIYQFQTMDLLTLSSKHGAHVDTITKDNQVIEIPCILPEWMHRIQKEVRNLQRFQKVYADYAKKHIQSISQLEMMSSFVQMTARFPGKKVSYSDISRARTLVEKVEALKKKISDQFLLNTDSSTFCGKSLSKVTETANRLWKLVKNKDFVDELKRYLPFFIDKPNHGPCGPDTIVEYGWKDIFSVLGEAYDALSQSSIGDEVFSEHIAPFFDYLASLRPDGYSDWPSNQRNLIDELKKALPKQIVSAVDNPLIAIMDASADKLDLAQTLFSPAPGFPSLFEAIINAYGHHLAKGISTPNIFQAARLIRSLFGLMKLLRCGKPLSTAQEYKLAQAANWGNLTAGKEFLYDYVREGMAERYGTAIAGAFKGAMFIFALVCFIAALSTDEEETLKRWTKIIGTGSNLVLTTVGIVLAKFELAKWFKIGTGCLGIVAGIAGIIIGTLDAIDAFHEKETAKGIISIIGVAGSLALTIGFALMAFGGATSLTGVGAILALVGLIVTVVASIVLMIMGLFTKETDSVFNQLRKNFTEDGGTYDTEYSKIGPIQQAYEAMFDVSRDMSWWLMAWRAIVPLYNLGFVVTDEKSGVEDLLETARFIEKIVHSDSDVGSYKVVLTYLLSYRRAKQNPTLDLDQSGLSDVTEWQRGTIYPNREPQMNMTF